MLATLGLVTACTEPATKSDGAALYSEFCASCHGVTGKGDGPAAAGLERAPSDLTTLSARNGGTFPLMDVLSTIDGYNRAKHGNLTMPEFGVMLEDQPLVLVDTGDGIETPTPEPLVAIADYLLTLQK
jgi:mono/diheme cytochrome c family protein